MLPSKHNQSVGRFRIPGFFSPNAIVPNLLPTRSNRFCKGQHLYTSRSNLAAQSSAARIQG